MVILCEVCDIGRSPVVQDFASYRPLVKPTIESAGKAYGHSGK